MRILIVEDDEPTAEALSEILTEQSYAIERASDGSAGLALAEAFNYDLILLDVILPKIDGVSLCRKLRSQHYSIPILLLTGRDSGHDKAVGLDAGADDYVVKPFDPEELCARIRALLRRGKIDTQPVLEWGNLSLDPSTCNVTYGEQKLSLTPKEYALLELLLRNSRRVLSCGLILEHLWSFEDAPGEEAVRTHIKGLRQKLKSASAPTDFVETVYGIGYRLKPLETSSLGFHSTEASAQLHPQPLQTAISNVWEHYADHIRQQIQQIEQSAQSLVAQTLSLPEQQQAERLAHSLAGSLGTFGYAAGSQTARDIEHLFQSSGSLSELDAKQLIEWVTTLRHQVSPPTPSASLSQPQCEWPLLLIISDDQPEITHLMAETQHQEMRANVIPFSVTVHQHIAQQRPDVILLDLGAAASLENGLQLLAELQTHQPPIPVLVLVTPEHHSLTSGGLSLRQRLDVARSGGRTILQKPVSPEQILNAVYQILYQGTVATSKILAVDDDLQVLAMLRSLLTPWGLSVTTLNQPQQFWETLEATEPDLLILDIKMPNISGIELCQVVRNDPRWSSLPIMILTAHTNAAIVNQVFAVGVDDFVSKPIVGPELVTRTINRLERTRFLKQWAEIDPLTRVSNRHKSTQDLNHFLHLAKQHNQPVCIAVIDLDNFKQINDRYGHAAGDRVLQDVGQLLHRSFRNNDVIARWGGEEFVVGMYGIPKQVGVKRLESLLQELHHHEFPIAHCDSTRCQTIRLHVTFSGGVAEYPDDGDHLHALYQCADAVLYQAKAAGRDRVLCAGC